MCVILILPILQQESTTNEGETFDFVVGELLDSFDKFKKTYINSHLRNIILDVESLVFIKGFVDEFHKRLTEKLQC